MGYSATLSTVKDAKFESSLVGQSVLYCELSAGLCQSS